MAEAVLGQGKGYVGQCDWLKYCAAAVRLLSVHLGSCWAQENIHPPTMTR